MPNQVTSVSTVFRVVRAVMDLDLRAHSLCVAILRALLTLLAVERSVSASPPTHLTGIFPAPHALHRLYARYMQHVYATLHNPQYT